MKLNNIKRPLFYIFFSLMVSALAAGCSPAMSQTLKKQRKIERAKRKIERILNKYPELRNTETVTVTLHDTIYEDKVITEIDTIIIDGTDTIVPIINIDQDSSKFIAIVDSDTFVVDIKTKYIHIKEPPKTYYIRDTITIKDTIVNTVTKIKEVHVVNTTKNFWFSLWLAIRGWIWWIFIILGIIVIIKLVLNKVINKLL